MSEVCGMCGQTIKQPAIVRRHGLTERMWQIADGIYKGDSYKQIAKDLKISIKTVNFTAARIRKIWKLHSKTQVILKIIELKKLDKAMSACEP